MISVIIPTYNHRRTLLQTIDSVLAQTDVVVEIIVVDDGSTDQTQAVLEPYRAQKNITIIHQENAGRNAARNRGYAASTGEFLLFLDADAQLKPQALHALQQALRTTDAAFAYADFRYGVARFRTGPFSVDRLRVSNYIHTSALVRRTQFPGFDPAIARFQDWDLWLTICAQGGYGIHVPGELMRFSTAVKGVSTWMPKSWYHAPWKWLPWIAPRVRAYQAARAIIQKKHDLS